jgi:hypothetical protein
MQTPMERIILAKNIEIIITPTNSFLFTKGMLDLRRILGLISRLISPIYER